MSRLAALACGGIALAIAITVAAAPAFGFARTDGRHGPDVVPVPALELDPPMMAYRAYVRRLFSVVERQLATLSGGLRAGDVAGAESAWLAPTWPGWRSARTTVPTALRGARRPDRRNRGGLVGGTAEPEFTGFHKVELDLWTDHDLGAAASDAADLARLVRPAG